MAELIALDHDAVLAAVSPAEAIERTRDAFLAHHRGDWTMPAKVYLDSPGFGDFRAMPARGGDLAMLKWISSFPRNPALGLPTVMGVVCLSDARTSEPLALLDARSVTALRTGAVAAVAAQALAPQATATVGIVGCGLHGAWAARCLAAAGYDAGVCCDPRADAAEALARELGPAWRAGTRAEALAEDVVCCVTPGAAPVVAEADLHPGLHLNMLGADGPGKAEATVDAVAACELFCDEWVQASHGGELTAAAEAGRVKRDDVTELGAVLAGDAPGRGSDEAVTLFDSTGLAIQDLAVAAAALEAHRAGRVGAGRVRL
jgi:ornithine cyclodeaminase/alanine dehydrogenase-like protein (mu-crystallin family)